MRKHNRYYFEELGQCSLTINGVNIQLVDLSLEGFCARSQDLEMSDQVRFELIINDCKVEGRANPLHQIGRDKFGFSIIEISDNFEHLKKTLAIAESQRKSLINIPPISWKEADLHFSEAISNEWYKFLFTMYDEIFISSIDFFRQLGYSSALMPITSDSISSPMGLGSDSLPVKINLFGQNTYLADSMQFQLEYLLRHGSKGVYYIMPTFRGEDPDERHLNQFFHSEAEILGDLDDVMSVIEDYVRFITENIFNKHQDGLKKFVGPDLSHLKMLLSTDRKIPRITLKEAKETLGDNKDYFSELPGGLESISSAGEKELMRQNGGIIWLTYPPHGVVPFYQAFAEDKKYAKSADLCMGIGETIGCGERHVTDKEANEALKIHEVDPNSYHWYLRMKKEYPLKTSGFGMGIERFLAFITKVDDIRNMMIFPRLKGYTHSP